MELARKLDVTETLLPAPPDPEQNLALPPTTRIEVLPQGENEEVGAEDDDEPDADEGEMFDAMTGYLAEMSGGFAAAEGLLEEVSTSYGHKVTTYSEALIRFGFTTISNMIGGN